MDLNKLVWRLHHHCNLIWCWTHTLPAVIRKIMDRKRLSLKKNCSEVVWIWKKMHLFHWNSKTVESRCLETHTHTHTHTHIHTQSRKQTSENKQTNTNKKPTGRLRIPETWCTLLFHSELLTNLLCGQDQTDQTRWSILLRLTRGIHDVLRQSCSVQLQHYEDSDTFSACWIVSVFS